MAYLDRLESFAMAAMRQYIAVRGASYDAREAVRAAVDTLKEVDKVKAGVVEPEIIRKKSYIDDADDDEPRVSARKVR